MKVNWLGFGAFLTTVFSTALIQAPADVISIPSSWLTVIGLISATAQAFTSSAVSKK